MDITTKKKVLAWGGKAASGKAADVAGETSATHSKGLAWGNEEVVELPGQKARTVRRVYPKRPPPVEEGSRRNNFQPNEAYRPGEACAITPRGRGGG
jgi:hypothetical protein